MMYRQVYKQVIILKQNCNRKKNQASFKYCSENILFCLRVLLVPKNALAYVFFFLILYPNVATFFLVMKNDSR